jgi:hypothetical protein
VTGLVRNYGIQFKATNSTVLNVITSMGGLVVGSTGFRQMFRPFMPHEDKSISTSEFTMIHQSPSTQRNNERKNE